MKVFRKPTFHMLQKEIIRNPIWSLVSLSGKNLGSRKTWIIVLLYKMINMAWSTTATLRLSIQKYQKIAAYFSIIVFQNNCHANGWLANCGNRAHNGIKIVDISSEYTTRFIIIVRFLKVRIELLNFQFYEKEVNKFQKWGQISEKNKIL